MSIYGFKENSFTKIFTITEIEFKTEIKNEFSLIKIFNSKQYENYLFKI